MKIVGVVIVSAISRFGIVRLTTELTAIGLLRISQLTATKHLLAICVITPIICVLALAITSTNKSSKNLKKKPQMVRANGVY